MPALARRCWRQKNAHGGQYCSRRPVSLWQIPVYLNRMRLLHDELQSGAKNGPQDDCGHNSGQPKGAHWPADETEDLGQLMILANVGGCHLCSGLHGIILDATSWTGTENRPTFFYRHQKLAPTLIPSVMKLSRTVEYAVQASLTLAEIGSDEPVPCSRLAAEGKMPERFLLQILRTLVTHDILVSTRGVEGGYRLSRPSTKISLLEIIEALEGPMLGGADGEANDAEHHSGRLGAAVGRIAANVRRALDDISLASLLDGKNSGRSR